jgi:hypothetical protein
MNLKLKCTFLRAHLSFIVVGENDIALLRYLWVMFLHNGLLDVRLVRVWGV